MRQTAMIAGVCVVVVAGMAWATGDRNRKSQARLEAQRAPAPLPATSPRSAGLSTRDLAFEARYAMQASRQARLETGDQDSFGRPLRWMGVVTTRPIAIQETCPPSHPVPCMAVNLNIYGQQIAEFRELGRITLPPRSVNSTLCPWLTPDVRATFANDLSPSRIDASLTITPSITVSNDVLRAPGLIDPDTGQPLNGKLELFARSIRLEQRLDYADHQSQTYSATRTCVNGILTRRMLIEVYGLSPRQANAFFSKPITLSTNATLVTEHVTLGTVLYSMRFVGD